MEHGSDSDDDSPNHWMERLLIAYDESLKLGVAAEQLSHVGSDLAPANSQRFQKEKHTIELLDRLFRQNSRIEPDQPQVDDTWPIDNSLDDALEWFPNSSRYRVIELLGAGAMGIVYKVVDQQRMTTVALKKLRENNPARILRFKQEFRRLANISHQNVVALFELAQAEHDWFIAMELVDGANFLQALSLRNIPLELSTSAGTSIRALRLLCNLFIQLANGLEALHAAGILHRDLKPNNVLVTAGDRVVVIDFGLAASFDWGRLHGARLQEIAGTFAYMAPEQIACQNLTPASDWYSFGVMLYQAFTGALPAVGPHSLVTKQYQQPPQLRTQLPLLPSSWNALCQALLAPEPQDRPTGQEITEQLREIQIAIDNTSSCEVHTVRLPVANRKDTRPFVGRAQELEQLHTAYRTTLRGQPTVVTIQGASGIGKTTLVESFLNEVATEIAGETQPVILRGRCYERESLPFKTLDSLVDSLCKYLTMCPDDVLSCLLPPDMPLLYRVFPVLGTLATSENDLPTSTSFEPDPVLLRRRAFEAFRELLLGIAQRSPLVIFIDDLQWGDAPGATVLADLLGTASNSKMQLILAYREQHSSGSDCLDTLQLQHLKPLAKVATDAENLNTPQRFAQCSIALGPLSPSDAAILAGNLMEAQPQQFTHAESNLTNTSSTSEQTFHTLPNAIASESGGMPFYVQELVRHVIDNRMATESSSLGSDAARISLSRVLQDRINCLSDTAQQVVSMVAVAGQPMAFELICHALGLTAVDDRQLHELCVNRWLRSDRDALQHTVTIFHDRIRDSIVSRLSPENRQQLHRNLAITLENSNATPETLAYHFDAGNHPERACHYLQQAGSHSLKVFAFEKAIEHYRRALELSPSENDRYHITRALGDATSQAGRGGEAAAAYLQAAELAPSGEALELRLAAARQYCIGGYTDEGRQLVRSVLASNGMFFPKQFWALVASLIYQRLHLRIQGLKVSQHAENQIPREELQRIDMMWSAVSGLSFQEPVAVAALHSQGLRAALAAGEPKRMARALALESILSATPGPKSNDRVQLLLRLTKNLAKSTNDGDSLGMLHLAEGGTAFLQVRMPDAVSPLIKAEKLFSSRVPKAWWELTTARSLLTWAYMHMGDFCALKRCIDLYRQDAQARGDRFLLSSISGAGIPQLHLAADQPELAQEGLDQLAESIPYEQFQQCHTSMLYSQAQIDLYRGNGLASWRKINDNWSLFRKSMQSQNQFARVALIDLRARCALLEFHCSRDRRLLRSAHNDLHRLKREVGTWVQAFVYRIQALLHEARAQHEQTHAALRQASEAFERIGFHSCAAAARRRQGQLMNDALGQQLIEQADDLFRTQSIIDTDAFQRVLC